MMNRNKFINKLIEPNKDRDRIIKLQQRFSNGEITEEELSKEEIAELHKLYDEQIKELKMKKEIYKRKIIKIKNQLEKNKKT